MEIYFWVENYFGGGAKIFQIDMFFLGGGGGEGVESVFFLEGGGVVTVL